MSPFPFQLHKHDYCFGCYKPNTITSCNHSLFSALCSPSPAPFSCREGSTRASIFWIFPSTRMPLWPWPGCGTCSSLECLQEGPQWTRKGGNIPMTDFRASSLLLSLLLHHFLMAIIGKEGRSYKYLWKLKGACTVLAERENIWRVSPLHLLASVYFEIFHLSPLGVQAKQYLTAQENCGFYGARDENLARRKAGS